MKHRIHLLLRDAALSLGIRIVKLFGPVRLGLRLMSWGWFNEGYSADLDYLQLVYYSAARNQDAFTLECGSGLTTILLGLTNSPCLVTLEHIPEWADKINAVLARFGIKHRATVAPLKNYGEYDWYDSSFVPPDISLVVCDGPPAQTRGGRYGLFPACQGKLTADVVILMDDLERKDEQLTLERWKREFGYLNRYEDSVNHPTTGNRPAAGNRSRRG